MRNTEQGNGPVGASFEARGLTVEVDGGGAPLLDDVHLSVRPGEALALVGPSGAGKTTFLRALGAAQRATGGSLEVDGVDLDGASPAVLRSLRSRLGFVHQDHCLISNLRVSQNVLAGKLGQRGLLAGARSMWWPRAADLERAYGLLTGLGVGDKLYQRASTLSGGEAQRVALARALFQEPRALLADEPVASVDPARGRDLVQRTIELARERGLTLIVSLHDVEIAREFFPRVVGMRAGRIAFDRPTAEVDAARWKELYALDGSEVGSDRG